MGSRQILCYITVVTKNWSLSDPDPKLIITDPDPAYDFGSERIRIHNIAMLPHLYLLMEMVTGEEEEELLLFCPTDSMGRGCCGRLTTEVVVVVVGLKLLRPPATPSDRMICVPGVMGVPGVDPHRTLLLHRFNRTEIKMA